MSLINNTTGAESISDVIFDFLRVAPSPAATKKKRNKIFFVCTSNTCRSPMAEGIGRKVVEIEKLPIEVGSLGLYVYSKNPSGNSVEICKMHEGIDISNHVPTDLCDTKNFDGYDNMKFVCMTNYHKKSVLRYSSENGLEDIINDENVVLMNNRARIGDPCGRSWEEYMDVYFAIRPFVEQHIKDFGTSILGENNSKKKI